MAVGVGLQWYAGVSRYVRYVNEVISLSTDKTLKTGLIVTRNVVSQPKYMLGFVALWLVLVWLFVYLTSFDVALYILNQSLPVGEKLRFFLSTYTNIFINLNDPLAFSIVVFSLLATVNLVLIIHLWRNRTRILKSHTTATSLVALVGSHCVACGGSLLAPVVTALAGSGAYFSAARANVGLVIGVLINLIGIWLITRSTLHIARQTAIVMPHIVRNRQA